MIYFDNAATSFPKPLDVVSAIDFALFNYASTGRSGHTPALMAAQKVFDAREEIAKYFNIDESERIVFTYNATYALNMAIKAFVTEVEKVAISPYEHNSVVRPLSNMDNMDFEVIESKLFDSEDLIHNFEEKAKNGVKKFILTWVSNVFGYILPIDKLDEIANKYDAKILLDASQGAGIIPLNLKNYKSISFVCMPGHKSLLGPQGTGVLIILDDNICDTLIEGGTGSMSSDLMQPEFLPDRFESGTVNVHGICGLLAGVTFLQQQPDILKHEREIVKYLYDKMSTISDIEIFLPKEEERIGILSFRHKNFSCEYIAEQLAEQDVCVRAGLHCSPLAHKTAGTYLSGLIRISVGIMNNKSEVDDFYDILQDILNK